MWKQLTLDGEFPQEAYIYVSCFHLKSTSVSSSNLKSLSQPTGTQGFTWFPAGGLQLRWESSLIETIKLLTLTNPKINFKFS